MTPKLNYAPGMIVANTVQTRAGEGGLVSVYSHAEASLIVDQTHHVPAIDADKVATIYDYAHRSYDSRTATKPHPEGDTTPRRWFSQPDHIAGISAKPGGPLSNAQAVIINATVTETRADGYATFSQLINRDGGQSTSTINYTKG